MLSTNEPNKKIIALDCVGTFDTPAGKYKILTVTIKIQRIRGKIK
jgi:hypothetical protein